MTSTCKPKTKKKSKSKAKKSPTIAPSDLSKYQRIPLTQANFNLLYNFVTGKFPETFGDPCERINFRPIRCPSCRYLGGWDYAGGAIIGPVYVPHNADFFKQSRVVPVRCVCCNFVYRVTEIWRIYFEIEEASPSQEIS